MGKRRLGPAQVVAALLVVLLVVGGALFTRSQGDRQIPEPTSPVGTTPGGDYVEGALDFPEALNPLLATSQSERDLCAILFRGLTSVDGSGQARPDLAEGWSTSDDGLSYTFRLKADIRWHDGTPVTARDIRHTIELIQDADFPGDPSLSRFWRAITVETPSHQDVVFRLLEPFAPFPTYASVAIVPHHLLGHVIARDLPGASFNLFPVGTGPFAFVDLQREGQVIKLTRSDVFDGDRPLLASITFRYYSDGESLLAAVRNHEVDGTGALSPSALLRAGTLRDSETVYAPSMAGFSALFFNLRNPLFANQEIRKAIELGIDRGSLLNEVLEVQTVSGTGPIPSSSWAYVEQATRSSRTDALQMLERAGWRDTNNDGVLENGTTQLSFPLLVNADDPLRVAVATEIARQLSSVKIRVDVQALSVAEVSQSLATRQFAAAIFGWAPLTGDPDCFPLWHSSEAEDGLNFVGWRDQRVDELLEMARRESDGEERKSHYAEFQQLFMRQVPSVVLYYPRYYFVASSEVHGIEADPVVTPSDRLRQVSRWYKLVNPEATPSAST